MTLSKLKKEIENNNFQYKLSSIEYHKNCYDIELNYRFKTFKLYFNFELIKTHIFKISNIVIVESKIDRSIFNSDIYEMLNILNKLDQK